MPGLSEPFDRGVRYPLVCMATPEDFILDPQLFIAGTDDLAPFTTLRSSGSNRPQHASSMPKAPTHTHTSGMP